MATPHTLKDEIRFRCERDLKPRLKRVVKAKHGNFAKYQAVARDVIRDYVETEESHEKKEGVAA